SSIAPLLQQQREHACAAFDDVQATKPASYDRWVKVLPVLVGRRQPHVLFKDLRIVVGAWPPQELRLRFPVQPSEGKWSEQEACHKLWEEPSLDEIRPRGNRLTSMGAVHRIQVYLGKFFVGNRWVKVVFHPVEQLGFINIHQ